MAGPTMGPPVVRPGKAARKTSILLLTITGVLAVAALFAPPLPQDPAYHQFADRRTMLGIPNALNVATNAPFAIIGILGLLTILRSRDQWLRSQPAWPVLFLAVSLTAFGSAFYHLDPNNATLFWDRLPMAAAFASLLSIVVADRVSRGAGLRLFPPLFCCAIASVVYWRLVDDLRLYVLVQFGSLLVILIVMVLFPEGRIRTGHLSGIVGWYAAAKILELLDAQVFGWAGIVSGHSLKHLAAGMAALSMWRVIAASPKSPPRP
jgi:hypothetical protein